MTTNEGLLRRWSRRKQAAQATPPAPADPAETVAAPPEPLDLPSIETLGMADCNDPALFVAEEEGKPIVTVPLDDNVPPHLYDPLSAFVTAWD